MPTIDCARPGHDLLDRPRQHGRGRGDGILLRPLRLDGDGADRERGRLPDAAARRPAGRRSRARLGRHRRLVVVDVRGERRRRPDVRGRDRERRRGRDGRDGRARRRAHGQCCAIRPARRSPSGRPASTRATRCTASPGTPIWSELMTRDRRGRRPFYALRLRLDGARAGLRRRPYTIWKRREQLVGGAVEMDDSWPGECRSHWMVYIATADCDDTARRCVRLGGTVWHAPDDVGPGRCALLEDPAGGAFSVITMRQAD